MGVQNLSLSIGPYTQEGSVSGILVHEYYDDGYGPRDIRLVWSTELGVDTNEYWTINISADGYYKGGYTRVSFGSYTEKFPAAQCNPVQVPNGRVWWSHTLDVGTLLSKVNGGKTTWSYADRVCDTIEFHVSVYSTWSAYAQSILGGTGSDVASLASVSIGFCPEYTITSVVQRPEALRINYSTTWTRIDDRYAFITGSYSGEGGVCQVIDSANRTYPLVSGNIWGTIPANGYIDIPNELILTSCLGNRVHINVRFNSVYRPIEMEFANAYGTFTVQNGVLCSDVQISVVENTDRVVLSTASLHNRDIEPDYVVVKLDEYGDTVQVPLGSDAVFNYVPFNTLLSFTAYGATDEGATSQNPAHLSVQSQPGDHVEISGEDTGTTVRMDYFRNTPLSVSIERDYDTVQLAGRTRPTAGYGSGVNKDIKISGRVILDAAWDYEIMFEYDRKIYVRFPDGRRYGIVGSCELSKVSDFGGGIWDVDISGTEVE